MASEIEMPDANSNLVDDGEANAQQGTEHSHNDSLPEPDTLLKRFELHAEQTPSKVAFTFLSSGPNGGKIQKHYTYQELDERTTALAKRLLDSSSGGTNSTISAGDCVVLVYPPCIEFIVVFLACCKAGITAVPVYPPNPVRRETIKAFSGIVEGCGAKVALTSEDYQHMKKLAGIKNGLTKFTKQQQVKWPELQWIVTDQANLHHSLSKKEATLAKDLNHNGTHGDKKHREGICFLQYTSGSTSEPKGVMVSHGNLAHNLYSITRELKASEDTIVVSWLPQYHDMGLIGAYLGILYCGGSGYYMSPLAFLQRPMMWIEAMSNYKATHVQAPNFAYKLTARKCVVADYPQTPNKNNKNVPLDLSSLRHMINGAEPIDTQGMEQFYTIFGNFGLKRGVIFPTYGLAEHTLFVCSGGTQVLTLDKAKLEVDGIVVEEIADNTKTTKAGDAGSNNDETTRSLVGCGYPSRQNIDVRIVHPETCVEERGGHVGEIWIRSPSKARGYYKNLQLTQDSFRAEMKIAPAKEDGETHDNTNNTSDSDDPSFGYLRTGDLGFMHKEELFICGRLKDLIIVGGRNYYPQDIEATAESTSDLLRPGCCAAFSLDSRKGEGTEEVALIMELRDIPSKSNVEDVCGPLISSIQSAIKREHSLSVAHFVLLEPRTIPKTTSGKIARSFGRKAYLAGTLKTVHAKHFTVADVTPDAEGEDAVNNNNGGQQQSATAAAPSPSTNQQKNTAEDIRSLANATLLKKLKVDIARMSQTTPDAIEVDAPLITVMDSLSLSQFKGMLEAQYYTTLSDEYLFRESTTTSKLVEVVKLGYAPDDATTPGGEGGSGTSPNPTSANSGGAGQQGGIAGAMGCPPGVCCSIM